MGGAGGGGELTWLWRRRGQRGEKEGHWCGRVAAELHGPDGGDGGAPARSYHDTPGRWAAAEARTRRRARRGGGSHRPRAMEAKAGVGARTSQRKKTMGADSGRRKRLKMGHTFSKCAERTRIARHV